MDPSVDIGPVITAESKARVERLIQSAEDEGATIALDGRGIKVCGSCACVCCLGMASSRPLLSHPLQHVGKPTTTTSYPAPSPSFTPLSSGAGL